MKKRNNKTKKNKGKRALALETRKGARNDRAARGDRHDAENGRGDPAPTKGNDTRKEGIGRKRGGQPGNCNARTHGLWAKYQPPVSEEERDPNAGPEQRREILERVIKVLYMDFCDAEDTETRCRIANTLCLAVTAANGCDRTMAIVTGKMNPLQQAIEELLAEEDPDDYSTIEQITEEADRGENAGETVPGEDAGDEDEVEAGLLRKNPRRAGGAGDPRHRHSRRQHDAASRDGIRLVNLPNEGSNQRDWNQ